MGLAKPGCGSCVRTDWGGGGPAEGRLPTAERAHFLLRSTLDKSLSNVTSSVSLILCVANVRVFLSFSFPEGLFSLRTNP